MSPWRPRHLLRNLLVLLCLMRIVPRERELPVRHASPDPGVLLLVVLDVCRRNALLCYVVFVYRLSRVKMILLEGLHVCSCTNGVPPPVRRSASRTLGRGSNTVRSSPVAPLLVRLLAGLTPAVTAHVAVLLLLPGVLLVLLRMTTALLVAPRVRPFRVLLGGADPPLLMRCLCRSDAAVMLLVLLVHLLLVILDRRCVRRTGGLLLRRVLLRIRRLMLGRRRRIVLLMLMPTLLLMPTMLLMLLGSTTSRLVVPSAGMLRGCGRRCSPVLRNSADLVLTAAALIWLVIRVVVLLRLRCVRRPPILVLLLRRSGKMLLLGSRLWRGRRRRGLLLLLVVLHLHVGVLLHWGGMRSGMLLERGLRAGYWQLLVRRREGRMLVLLLLLLRGPLVLVLLLTTRRSW